MSKVLMKGFNEKQVAILIILGFLGGIMFGAILLSALGELTYDSSDDVCLVGKHYRIVHSTNWAHTKVLTSWDMDLVRSYGYAPNLIGTECVSWRGK